ncbi:MAG: tetratricopeptide repeat protein [Blastocatellia bacterium]|nr:tetratricopeptide repeat protein [Blastocatellia bacterium]
MRLTLRILLYLVLLPNSMCAQSTLAQILERANMSLERGDLAAAAEQLEQALTRHESPQNLAELYKRLALVEYLLQRFDRFDEHLREAIRLNPLDADARYQLGRRFFEEKRYREAMSEFQEALRLQPSHYKAHYYAGLVHKGENDTESAKREFQAAVEIVESIKAHYAWPFTDLGELLVEEGDYERGVGWLYRATRIDPKSPHARYHYARALFQKESGFEVKEALLAAISLDPGYSEAYYLLARYYQKTGEERLSKETFAKFEELKKNPVPSPFGLRRQ